jgi:hypothetical protein
METIPRSQWRAEIRASVDYLRIIRPLVQQIAAEHAAWARFVGTAASPTGSMSRREQSMGALRFAISFAGLRGRLQRAGPSLSCATLHESALGLVEALDLLASAVPPALDTGSIHELRAIGREAGEAQLRLRIFQRTHAATIASLKQMFAARPRTRTLRPVRRGPHVASVKHAPRATVVNLPPWRRPRPAMVRRAASF